MLKKLIIFAVALSFSMLIRGQDVLRYATTISWDQSRLITLDDQVMSIPWDEDLSQQKPGTPPVLTKSFALDKARSFQQLRLKGWKARWETINLPSAWQELQIPKENTWDVSMIRMDDRYYLEIEGLPLKSKTDSTIDLATHIEWEIAYESNPPASRDIPFADQSVLRTGTFYKIRIPESGVFKLDPSFFEDVLGTNISEIDPSSVQLYAGQAGMLPQALSQERVDDLEEIALWYSGSGNTFTSDDYFLFYAQGPSPWQSRVGYNWKKPMNVYDQYQYLFLRLDGTNGKRVERVPSLSSTAFTTDIYLDHARYEVDKVNLLGEFISGEGSGQQWFGDIFTNTRSKEYTDYFQWNRLIPDSNLMVRSEFAGRISEDYTAQLRLTVNGTTFSKNISGVLIDKVLATYARTVNFNESFPAGNDELSIALDYPPTAVYSEGWLDYIQVEGYRELHWNSSPFEFSHPGSADFASTTYELSGVPSDLRVWDITQAESPISIDIQTSGDRADIGIETNGEMRRLYAFEEGQSLQWAEEVGNQNLHSMEDAEMLIIYHPEFEDQALRLRDHRIAYSGLDARVISTEEIYNEFASGKSDPSAIRNFAKMIYDRAPEFKYLLLFGDATYDYRGLDEELNYENFVPTFETESSLHPIYSFPTDDYFALLSDNEGGSLKGALDIAVGRLPITTTDEAENLVDKIIRYESESSTYGPWRLNLGYSADDGDSNRHLNQSDDLAQDAEGNYPVFNSKKFYLDAYPRLTTPGGVRFPQANQSINEAIFQGLLVFNYLGHGGPFGLTQERVLTVNDIGNWENKYKLPLFITATCTFSPYDDPAANSGGELVLHNREGGGIALYSTVRAVLSGSNKRLNDAVFHRLFKRYEGEVGTLGETMMNGKNANSADTTFDNARKFALLGDPAMKLAVPKHEIAITEINDSEDLYPLKDTLNALDKVTVKGEVRDRDGNLLPGFSGVLHATVFDKAQTKQTLGQSSDSYSAEFTVRNNVMFKGNATVTSGTFSFSFVIPQDIDYELGQGRISLYAYDGQSSDASGYYEQFIVGGSSDTLIDDSPPIVDVYMNTTDFKSGGITNENPTLYALINDDLGINVTGTSIGHDMVAILDGKEEDKFVLNDYFESDLDDYTSGSVRFPLGPLEEGHHEVEVRAYDIANNVGIGRTEFIVVNDENELIDHIINYPNPFSSYTYFEIAHNLPPGQAELDIQIFNSLGQQVTTLQYDLDTDGYLIKLGPWSGSSDYGGGSLADGTYYYRVILTRQRENGPSVELISETKKLILIK